jgi:D-alanyl-D-alanine carboxypeptidase
MCRVVLRYEGDDDHKGSTARTTFPCWLPLRLGAYSPEQLPSNAEHALEGLRGVEATTFWSGTKFMKSSRVPGGPRVDSVSGSYTIPLDTAFVEPREFARFARPEDRDRIRSLDGRRAVMADGEVGLREGHAKLKMRFTVGRARTVGSISNKSAQGYELVMAKPAAHASVAFRVVLIEKPPSVSKRSIREVLRRVLGPNKHLELSSEKQVPFLRHGQLVRPQLFVKKAFGEFAMHPSTGRSIAIKSPWVGNNIRTWSVPVLGRVTCHKKLFPQLRGAMRELKNKGLAGLATRGSYAGCFNPRFISSYTGSDVGPVERLSRHAWGVALDINANLNPFGAPPRQDPRLVRIMRKWGFNWGGRWAVPDGMHFEWKRVP